MGSRGRKSEASLAVVPAPIRHEAPRLAAPCGLTAAELAVWRLTVSALPSGHFSAEQAPLLERFCIHTVRARSLDALLATLDAVADLDRYDKLARLVSQETGRMFAAGRALRLTNQSRMKAETAGTRAAAVRGPTAEGAEIDRRIAARSGNDQNR